MKITSLKATGIKRQNIDIEPRPVNIILGRNGAGKSAIKDALELGLLGYSPEIGKRPGDIFRLSKSDPIYVDIETDGVHTICRKWQRNGESIKSTSNCEFESPAVMLDLSSVKKLTKAERQKYFAELLDIREITWESVTAAIKKVEVKEATEQTEKAISSVVDLANTAKGATVQERLINALELLNEQTKKVNAEIKDHEGLARTFSRQEELEFEVPVTNAKKAVATARTEVEAAAAEVTKWQNALRDYQAKKDKLKALEAEGVADVSELDKSLAELVGKISDAEVKLETLNTQLEEMQPEAVNKKFSELSAKVATLTAEYNAIGARGKELTIRRESEINLSASLVNALITKRTDIETQTCCPTCGADGESWKDKLIATYDLELDAAQSKHNKELAAIDEKILACAEELESKKSEGREARKAKEGAEVAVEASKTKRQEITEAQATLNKLNYERQTLTNRRQEIIDKSASHLAAIRNLQSELAGVDEFHINTELARVTSDLEAKRSAQTEVDKALQKESAELGNKLTLFKSMKRRDEVTAELVILKGATKVLLEMQQNAINNAFEPLVTAIRKFTDGVLDTPPIDFHDGNFGYWLDDIFVEIDTFSGSQKRLALLGQMIALASASGAPLKVVIIDELGDFEPTLTRPALIERLVDLATDGTIDHAFLMANDVEYYDIWRNGSIDVLVHEVIGNEQ